MIAIWEFNEYIDASFFKWRGLRKFFYRRRRRRDAEKTRSAMAPLEMETLQKQWAKDAAAFICDTSFGGP